MKRLILGLALAMLALTSSAGAVTAARVTVSTTATLIYTAPQRGSRVLIRNPSTVSVYIGGTSAVTTSTGFEVAAGDSVSVKLIRSETIYGIVAAATQVVHYIDGDYAP